MAMSKLFIPGLQQRVRGELPVTPSVVGTAKRFGSNTRFDTGVQGVAVPLVGPVPSAHPPFRGSCVWNLPNRSGWPGDSKSKLPSNSVSAELEISRIGNPDWKVAIPENAHPFSALPANPDILGTGSS